MDIFLGDTTVVIFVLDPEHLIQAANALRLAGGRPGQAGRLAPPGKRTTCG